MRRLFKVLISTILVINMAVIIAMTALYNPDKSISVNTESELLAPQVRSSRMTELPKSRGAFSSTMDLVIPGEGNGDAGVFAKAYMEVPVDEAYITVYLDQQSEDAERRRQVTFYDTESYLKDYPSGATEPETDMIFKDQPKGHYYRLRGVFGTVLDGRFRGFGLTTAGILTG